MQFGFMAEHHDRVAGFNLGVTIHQHTSTLTHQSANGHTEGQSQVFYRLFGDLW